MFGFKWVWSHLFLNICIDTIISVSVDVEGELGEADAYMKALEAEFRTMMTGDRRANQAKLTEFKNELNNLHANYSRVKMEAEQDALKNGSTARAKMTAANTKLDQSTKTLESSRMLVAQTEGIGNTIISDLEGQREQLTDAQTKVEETKQYTVDAKQVLKDMHRRAIIHKVLVYVIIVILFGVIVCEIYFGFMKKK